MPTLRIIETSLPEHVVERELLAAVANDWLPADADARSRFLRLSAGAGVEKRHFILPYQDTLQLGGLEQRAALFERHGTAMLADLLDRTLARFTGDPKEISHFLFSSCSVPIIPSPETEVILNSPLSPSISRIPTFQHGCAGGVAGLALGAKLAGQGAPVLISALELCSLVFHPENHSAEQLVGAAIFGDGAAMAIVEPGGPGLRIVDSMSRLIPNTRHLMGYDLFDSGFHLRLDRELPAVLADYAPTVLQEFLERRSLDVDAIDFWLFHPGGKRILDFFSDRFGLDDAQFCWSREVLAQNGNLSSATILFVLERFIQSGLMEQGGRALVVGIGPGLTIELILLESGREMKSPHFQQIYGA